MKAGLISYEHALSGEDKLDAYQLEIARVCAIFNWNVGSWRREPQDTSHPQAWIIGNADLSWQLSYVDRDFFQVLRCTFVNNGQPLVEWTPERGIKVLYPSDKMYDVPRARANLQSLVDAVCEKHVSVRQRFLELQQIAKE